MQQGSIAEDPAKWSTRHVVAWMKSFDDSRDDIKKKVLEVVETNDIDGLTLKQLRADSEEIHTLFPSLKERLTFKAMLRDIFKDVRCSHCYVNGSNNNTCAADPPPPKQRGQSPATPPQLTSKTPNHANHQANHRAASNHAQKEDTNHKSAVHQHRTSPLHSPRPHALPRQESKENSQVIHVDHVPPNARAKLTPISVGMVPNTPPIISPRERELSAAPIQRFIGPQGLHGNQLLSHGSSPVAATPMYPFAPIAGQFNMSVANQALAAALAARGLPHQQPYQHQQHPQQHVSSTASTPVASSPTVTSRPGLFPLPNHQRAIAPAPSTASAPPAPTQRASEYLPKDNHKDLPATSTSSASASRPAEHLPPNSQATSDPSAANMPLIGSRGRPATKGAIRSAKISQKYKKIIQRMKSAHKQVIEIPYPAPLPSFSQLLRQQIGRGNIANFRSRFTYECAQYYMSLNPTPSHTEYRNISKTIVENFPILASPDEDVPWRKFNNQLSQAIRNIRRQLRSVPNSGYPPAQKRKYWRNLASQLMCSNHSALSLSHLTQQQQQQFDAQGHMASGSSADQAYDALNHLHRNDSASNDDEDDEDDDNIIILKEEGEDEEDRDEDDDDIINDYEGNGKEGEDEGEENDNYDSEEDDGITPTEWVGKKE